MAENTYTGTVETEHVYSLMAQHARVSMQANELAFERMFEVEELDAEARLEATQRELALVTEANSLAFQVASAFMDDDFRRGFQEHWNSHPAES